MYTSIVDGGYALFYYGCRNPSAWNEVKHRFTRSLVAMEGQSFRKAVWPDYKSRRREKRERDPDILATYEQVQELRRFVMEDAQVAAASVDGAEADDLVAALHLTQPNILSTVAIDKDMIQVPGLARKMVTVTGEPSNPSLKKLSKYVAASTPKVWKPIDVVLYQVLFGDRSDSIPRILPSTPKTARLHWLDIRKRGGAEMLIHARKLFGEQVVVNLQLVLMPGNLLRDEPFHPDGEFNQLAEAIENESYWDPAKFSVLTKRFFGALEERTRNLEELWTNTKTIEGFNEPW